MTFFYLHLTKIKGINLRIQLSLSLVKLGLVPVLFELEIFTEILEGRLDLVRLGRVFLWQNGVHEPL